MRILQKLNTYIGRVESLILVVIVLVMVILSFAQVVLRNVFDQGILWGDIFLRHLVLWVGFIGASIATQEEKHINIDVFTRYIKGKGKYFTQALINVFAAFVSFLLMQAAWTFVMEEREFETMLFNNIPAWYFQIIIPVGFGLMTLRFVINCVQKLTDSFANTREQSS
jgi:TRAP-type C4-dicarboxylate transport system permease small subunit